MIGLRKPLAAVALLSVIGTSLGSETSDKKALEDIAGYRQWTHAALLQIVSLDLTSVGG